MKKLAILVYLLLGGFLFHLAQSISTKPTFAKANYISDSNYLTNPNFITAAEKSIDAVVHVKSKYVKDEYYRYYHPFFGNQLYNQPTEKIANGSGVIISEDGYIVTNKHVINESQEIEIVLNNKRTYSAKILGTDSSTDLALLKIDAADLKNLKFSNSDQLKVGEWVLAIGNPFNLNSTVTAGIISAKARSIDILNNRTGIESFIQTDAAINPGNSGGALVNTNGDLIGINTAIQSNTGSYTGYGFAIPSNMVKKIITDLKEYGEVRRAYIGINIADINQQIVIDLKLKNAEGVLITKVLNDGAAKKHGIEDLDILLSIDDLRVNSVNQLQEKIAQFRPGDSITCIIKRKGETKEIKLVLEN